ncbi:MAG: Inner membrane transport permease YhhJ [Xylophilus sp.]|nr:hypothetical protein [Xylophilus sp.]KAF1045443.1 MAG: Inner membrane transport permease YhhJ [Xylophilus sp.]
MLRDLIARMPAKVWSMAPVVQGPARNMPQTLQILMQAAPTTHFVELGQAAPYRCAGIAVVWKPFAFLPVTGALLFALSLARFRRTISQMA